jgi:cytosine/adenosine deaminase-related metal-dependent hydrolase
LSDRQLLAMATTAGGIALHLPGAGRLRRGGRADFVALPVPDADDDAGPLAALVRGTGPLARVHCGGRRIA